MVFASGFARDGCSIGYPLSDSDGDSVANGATHFHQYTDEHPNAYAYAHANRDGDTYSD